MAQKDSIDDFLKHPQPTIEDVLRYEKTIEIHGQRKHIVYRYNGGGKKPMIDTDTALEDPFRERIEASDADLVTLSGLMSKENRHCIHLHPTPDESNGCEVPKEYILDRITTKDGWTHLLLREGSGVLVYQKHQETAYSTSQLYRRYRVANRLGSMRPLDGFSY